MPVFTNGTVPRQLYKQGAMLYWTVDTEPRVGAVLAWYSPSPETKFRLTTDSEVMPVLNQYSFQCWHGTDVQYHASAENPSVVLARYQAGCKFPPGNFATRNKIFLPNTNVFNIFFFDLLHQPVCHYEF